MTPEQKAWVIINILQIAALAALLWWWAVDELFDWIERRYRVTPLYPIGAGKCPICREPEKPSK